VATDTGLWSFLTSNLEVIYLHVNPSGNRSLLSPERRFNCWPLMSKKRSLARNC
jgi:hypothetical protein